MPPPLFGIAYLPLTPEQHVPVHTAVRPFFKINCEELSDMFGPSTNISQNIFEFGCILDPAPATPIFALFEALKALKNPKMKTKRVRRKQTSGIESASL